jgi:hypothetical protein
VPDVAVEEALVLVVVSSSPPQPMTIKAAMSGAKKRFEVRMAERVHAARLGEQARVRRAGIESSRRRPARSFP